MCETRRYPQHLVIVGRELNFEVLTIRGGAFANVYHHIEHGAHNHAHQFTLRKRRGLKMQTAEDATGGKRLVVLHKIGRQASRLEGRFAVTLKKMTPSITPNFGLNDLQAFERSMDDFH